MSAEQEQVLFDGLVTAFNEAFVRAAKEGLDIKELFWFRPEKEKLELEKIV